MAESITNAFKNQYHMTLMHALQQKMSKLRPYMKEYSVKGEYYDVDFLSATSTTAVTASHQDTTNTDMTMSRRRLSLSRYTHAPLIDTFDKLKLMIDPTSDYVQNAVGAFNRTIDELVIDAFTATVTTGKTGSGTATFDNDNVISSSSSGLGVDKLRQAKRILDLNEAGDERFIVVSPYQIDDLLNNTKVASADYNTVRALVYGEIDTFMGFKFITSNLINKSASDRHCLAWSYESMALGIGKDMETNIDRLPTKNYDWQVFTEMFLGAIRLYEGGVVRIDCTES